MFIVHVPIPRYTPLADQHREALWRWLTRGSVDRWLSSDLLTAARIKEISVDDALVSTSFNGVVSRADRLQHALDPLRRLASDRAI